MIQDKTDIGTFIEGLPKAELHLHIEGSFEAELMFKIAERNDISIPFDSVEKLKKAYSFNNLQEFLDIYYAGANVLIEEEDFYELTKAYLDKIHRQKVVHTEIFFDPQTHTDRGVDFDKVITGIHRALEEAKKNYGITYRLIMSFLRHLDEASAFDTLESGLKYRDIIDGVGLDSSELGNPPSKFKRVFAAAAKAGFKLVAHAGEEGPADYIWEALDELKVLRIDHGNRCLDDEALTKRLVDEQMPLTLCPLSNTALQVIKRMEDHPVKRMMDLGLLATIHSDDPAYFGGYMNENFMAVAEALAMNKTELAQLSKNAFTASWLSPAEIAKHHQAIDDYVASFGI